MVESLFIILAGLPAATQKGGISLVTIEPAPIILNSQILTTGNIIAPSPIQQLRPITTGPLETIERDMGGIFISSMLIAPWALSDIVILFPRSTWSPKTILLIAVMWQYSPI